MSGPSDRREPSRARSGPTQVVAMDAPMVAALAYAAREWLVFPCHTATARGCTCGQTCSSPGKHPRTRNGARNATRDPATVRAWWTRWPDANVAIGTGRQSGLVVIDLDPRHGAMPAWRALLAGQDPVAVGPIVETGSHGWHLYFAHPGGDIPNSVGRVGSGIVNAGRIQ